MMRLQISLVLFIFTAVLRSQNCEILVWADEFSDTTLNLDYWNYDIGNGCPELCGWGNNEEQYYTNSKKNVHLEDGKLIITALEEPVGGMNFSSGKITTKNKIDFAYGRIECRAKLPETQGLWPAFWLLSTDNIYGEWPKSGEIDIFEVLGSRPDSVLGTVHTGLPWIFKSGSYTLEEGQTFANDFHTFALEWSPDTLEWYVDDILYHVIPSDSITPWEPFSEDFHIILNVAVGGNLPGFTDETTMLPQSMEVDYVRLYSMVSDLAIQGQDPSVNESGVVYKTFKIDSASYEWTVPDNATIVSGQGTSELVVDWGCTPGDIQLIISTDCGTDTLKYMVEAFQKLSITGLTEIEPGQKNISFSVPEFEDANYIWSLPNDAIIVEGEGTSEILVNWGCVEGPVEIEIRSNCDTIEGSLPLEFIEHDISGFAFVGENSQNQRYRFDSLPNVTYLWKVTEGLEIASGQGTPEITVNFGDQGGTISVDITGDCGTQTYTFDVTISSMNIYCDFDGTDLDFGGFAGSVFAKIENQVKDGINTSDHIGITRKDPGSQSWAGIFADLGGELDLEDNPFLHMKVFTESSGEVLFKLEDQTGGVNPVEIGLEMTQPEEWVNLTYDFTGQPSETFDRIALFFDFGNTDTSYWAFDDIISSSTPTTSMSQTEVWSLKAFPNPTSGLLQINFDNDQFMAAPRLIKLTNEMGQQLISRKVDSGQTRISFDLSPFPPGIYILNVFQGNHIYLKQIIIQ